MCNDDIIKAMMGEVQRKVPITIHDNTIIQNNTIKLQCMKVSGYLTFIVESQA